MAEPFYRATGRQPMGLARRRHFATRGRQLLRLEDELFGDAARQPRRRRRSNEPRRSPGQGALITALETARTGRLGDIVATIQGEQDEIIRAPLPGVLVVQGGPGTGKTVVALHRAAYLLYTHRFPLEGQGVLVVGPNRLFLGYIEQVLPSLGEAGVELAVLADLVPRRPRAHGCDRGLTARVKGDLRMVALPAPGRPRPRSGRCAPTSCVGYGLQRLTPQPSSAAERIVADARRRYRRHNGGPQVRRGARSSPSWRCRGRDDLVGPSEVRERLRHDPSVREALEWMWPVLTPAQLLHDLFGAQGPAAPRRPRPASTTASGCRCYRPRSESLDRGRLDPRRRARCSTRPARCSGPSRSAAGPARPRRRRDPHLRPHRGRRGPGPLADAAADARRAARSTAR